MTIIIPIKWSSETKYSKMDKINFVEDSLQKEIILKYSVAPVTILH